MPDAADRHVPQARTFHDGDRRGPESERCKSLLAELAATEGVLGVGGVHKKVRIPSTEDRIKRLEYEYKLKIQEIQIKEIKRGSFMFIVGCVAAGIGFILHFLTAYPIAQRASEWVLAGGLSFAGIGLVIKKAAQYQNFIALGLVVILVVFILYKCRKWSLSHVIKGKGKPNESTDSEN